MTLSRRELIGLVAIGTAASAVVAGCSSDAGDGDGAQAAPGPSSLDSPVDVTASPPVIESTDAMVGITWRRVTSAQSYDIELNGQVVASSTQATSFDISQGNGRTGFSAGVNRVRVRGRAGDLEGPWSDAQSFAVRASHVVRWRGFDAEGDGPIALTTGGEPASDGIALRVGAEYAHGGGAGKGVALVCTDASDSKVYKNHDILPVPECWVRIGFSPRTAGQDDTRIQLLRINDSVNDVSERLLWVTGTGVCSTSVKVVLPVPDETWVQLQLGVHADGKVELWAFDGLLETLVGTGRSDLVGATKDRVSIGNHNPNIGFTFEAWMDDFAVGESRLPWVLPEDPRTLTRPKPLVASDLPKSFSFAFGSCMNSNHFPATGTALAAAADADPDFFLHLGDFGYLDSAGYAQSVDGYLASWSDLMAGEHMSRLAAKPWVMMCSDHDLGGNNVVADTVAPFAADAFARYHSNDTSTDGVGRYGSVAFDEGRVLLVWTEGVLHRSHLDEPLAAGNTKLGGEQKAWLLNLLSTTTAKLVLIGSETTFAHQSKTSWSNHPAERAEVLFAAAACPAQVRILSGDLHRARWARLAPNVVEWGAAAMSEFPEGVPAEVEGVIEASTPTDFHGYGSRPLALAAMTIAEFNATTTFGLVSIDTTTRAVRFELRCADGTTRVDGLGRPMEESFVYG